MWKMKLRIRPRVGYGKYALVEVEVDPTEKCRVLKEVCFNKEKKKNHKINNAQHPSK